MSLLVVGGLLGSLMMTYFFVESRELRQSAPEGHLLSTDESRVPQFCTIRGRICETLYAHELHPIIQELLRQSVTSGPQAACYFPPRRLSDLLESFRYQGEKIMAEWYEQLPEHAMAACFAGAELDRERRRAEELLASIDIKQGSDTFVKVALHDMRSLIFAKIQEGVFAKREEIMRGIIGRN